MGAAAARSSWLGEETPPPDAFAGQGEGSIDPVSVPSEIADGPLSRTLAEQVSVIPEFATLEPVKTSDFSEGGTDAGILAFLSPDGAMVNVVSQQLPGPLTLDRIGSPEDTRVETGPNGEEIIIKETRYVLQVIGVNASGWMVNVIVDRILADSSGELSSYSTWDAGTVRSWVLELLKAQNGN